MQYRPTLQHPHDWVDSCIIDYLYDESAINARKTGTAARVLVCGNVIKVSEPVFTS